MQFKQPNLDKKKQNMTALRLIKSIDRSSSRLALLLIPLALACFGLLPRARAVTPAPDGGYPNRNTAEGEDALFSLTDVESNTATGEQALFHNTTGYNKTANGVKALFHNTSGSSNTANGINAMLRNTSGNGNIADGRGALGNNTAGSFNVAIGFNAGSNLTTGRATTSTSGL